MAKFRIKVTGLSVKGGKMAKGNEVVDESQLLSPSKDLIKSGHIEAEKTEVKKKSVKK